jgi:hypothetical protein
MKTREEILAARDAVSDTKWRQTGISGSSPTYTSYNLTAEQQNTVLLNIAIELLVDIRDAVVKS